MTKNRTALLKGMTDMERAAPALNGPHPVRTLTALTAERGVIQIPLANIAADPHQPRKFFDPTKLEELADSIRQKGVLQPITVRAGKAADSVIVIAGERRLRAAKLAGLDQIPCLVRTGDDAHEVALIENVQRENLTPLEEAEALQRLKIERAYTDEKLAAVIGKSRRVVSETMQLTNLPQAIKDEWRTSAISGKDQLLRVLRAGSEEKQLELWQAIKTGQLPTVKATREATTTIKKATAQIGRPKNFRHMYKNPKLKAQVTVTFQKKTATAAEVKNALKAALNDLT